jgi:transcriptional regulator with XRE-family HTH domain
MLQFYCRYRQLYIDDYNRTCRLCQVKHNIGDNMDTSERNIFAERLRFAREKIRNLTQAQLSEKSGLPATSISHFENTEGSRKPSFDNLRRLAKALDVTTDYLLGSTESPMGIIDDTDALYRDVKSLSEDDKKFAEDMIKKMIERNREKNNK